MFKHNKHNILDDEMTNVVMMKISDITSNVNPTSLFREISHQFSLHLYMKQSLNKKLTLMKGENIQQTHADADVMSKMFTQIFSVVFLMQKQKTNIQITMFCEHVYVYVYSTLVLIVKLYVYITWLA